MPQERFSRRHFLALTGSTLAAISAAAACSVPLPDAAPGHEPSMEGVELTHWQHHAPGRTAAVESFMAEFQLRQPQVEIRFQSIPWSEYWGKLATGIAGGAGSAPDIFQIPMGLIEEYIEGGSLLPVSETVMPADRIAAEYLPWTVSRSERDGIFYGLPLDVQTMVMYRNNRLYEAAGLDPAAPYADLEELFAQSVSLTRLEGDEEDRIGLNTSYYSAYLTLLFQQYLQRDLNGVSSIDPQTDALTWPEYPELLRIFEWFCELSGRADDSAFLAGQDRFALHRAASQLGFPVFRSALALQAPELDYTIVPFPVRTSGQDLYTVGSHWMWVTGRWTPDIEASWRWVRHCTNRDAQITWSEVAGDLPSLRGLTEDPRFRPDANADVCMDSLAYATPCEWVGWHEWFKEFGDARDRVVIGGENPADSYRLMVTRLNGIIASHTV